MPFENLEQFNFRWLPGNTLIGSIQVIKESLIERMVVVEQSCKSAHHRLDGLK